MKTLGGLSVMGAGILLMGLAEKPWQDLLWWGALGIVCYGLTALLHVNLNLLRLFRKVDNQKAILNKSLQTNNKDFFADDSPQHWVQLKLSPSQYEQINAKAQLFGKTVEGFCRMVIMDSKAKLK